MTRSVVIKTAKQGPRTAGTLLFDKPFYVTMAEIDAMDEMSINYRGSFTTGYSDVDEKMLRRPTSVWRTVNELVELVDAGAEVDLVYGMKDAETIHKLIQEHLADCAHYHSLITAGIKKEDKAITEARLRDLKRIDAFGRMIYNKVRRFGKEEPVSGIDKTLQDSAPLVGDDGFSGTPVSIRNSPDYVPIEERIDYSALNQRKRYHSR